jgi:hypothetical protein
MKPRPNIPLRLRGKTRRHADGTLGIDTDEMPEAELMLAGNAGPTAGPVSRKARRAAKAKARKQGRVRASVH